ncbi:glycosyltransferase family 4 protein [bacterium]|nr:glycosyltransferase family 4 protein [bacterium]
MSRRRIRVVHIITRLDPGGSAENTVLSAERVDPDRFKSTVWTGPGISGEGPPLEYSDRLGLHLKVIHHLVRPIEPFLDLRALLVLVRRLRKSKPDILHLHSAKAGVLGRVAAKLARSKAKVIYTPHGHLFSGYGGQSASRLFGWIEKRLASFADAIVGLTQDEVREFLQHGAGSKEQFCVIPSGVELDPYLADDDSRATIRTELNIPDDAPVVGFIGRFAEVKGPDQALEVIAKAREEISALHFLFVGDGEMRSALESQAKKLGLDDIIHWTGWRKDVPHLLKAMDLFLLTSRNEGQGRVLVEAMATRLPVVAMATGGVSEVVMDGKTGVLTAAGDVEATATAVVELLGNRNVHHAFADAGRERAIKHFSLHVMIQRLERLYQGLLESRTPESILSE